MSLPFALLTWRECVVGMKPTEAVLMNVRRTWDLKPVTSSGTHGGQTFGGGVESENLGYVRWRMSDTTLFDRPYRLLRTEGYDKRAEVLTMEEVWADAKGDMVRQREERRTKAGKQVAEAVFWPDHIELTRVDVDNHSTFSQVNPAGGMGAVQARFHPISEGRKEFLKLDAIDGTFSKVEIERGGRFRGTWAGDAYDGATYRFTVDGATATLMLTAQDEAVQVAFDAETALVLDGPTKSRRKSSLASSVPSPWGGVG